MDKEYVVCVHTHTLEYYAVIKKNKNFGIIQANSVGVVDSSYCGDNDWWYFPAIAMRDTTIEEGARSCQFRIMENQTQIIFDEVDSLNAPDRGGIGSTGKN